MNVAMKIISDMDIHVWADETYAKWIKHELFKMSIRFILAAKFCTDNQNRYVNAMHTIFEGNLFC